VRNFAICGPTISAFYPLGSALEAVSIDGVRVACAVLETADREFDPELPWNARRVLVRVRRFSCNYRDKSFVVRAAAHMPPARFLLIGSEFVGEVVAVGRAVRRVRPGDRVIGDNSYPDVGPGDPPSEPRGGVATSRASGERLVLHEDKVAAIPAAMPDDVAAAFSLGAQTAFSMTEKLAPRRGDHVLVTAARSNTSLFAVEALCRRGAVVHATTTSARHVDRLRARGVDEVFVVDPARPFAAHDALAAAARAVGGYTGAIDPFFDLHLGQLLPLLRHGARYVTCGLYGQRGTAARDGTAPGTDCYVALCQAIVRNVALIGNCVGKRHHLEEALAAYERGEIDVAIDSVVSGDHAGTFLTRTFAAPDRFGKVVYAYE
jgi:NADPH:quinone reductase-like Zn-dependent oxidoreductase